jgi:tRNA dimethylallyltransferase
MPEIGPDFEFREKMFAMEGKDPGYLHKELERVDPDEAKKIHPKSTRYLVRALEIFHSSGKTKTESFLEKEVEQPILMM